jgi:hypothetical protein
MNNRILVLLPRLKLMQEIAEDIYSGASYMYFFFPGY